MWGKIYFWLLLMSTVIGLLSVLPVVATWNFAFWLSVGESIILLLGVYSYLYKKTTFGNLVWKYVFYLLIIDTVVSLVHFVGDIPIPGFLIPNNMPDLSALVWIIATIFYIPSLVAIYRLGFSPKKK